MSCGVPCVGASHIFACFCSRCSARSHAQLCACGGYGHGGVVLHFFNCFYGDGTYYRGTESVIGPYYVLGEQYERPLLAAAECHRGQ